MVRREISQFRKMQARNLVLLTSSINSAPHRSGLFSCFHALSCLKGFSGHALSTNLSQKSLRVPSCFGWDGCPSGMQATNVVGGRPQLAWSGKLRQRLRNQSPRRRAKTAKPGRSQKTRPAKKPVFFRGLRLSSRMFATV